MKSPRFLPVVACVALMFATVAVLPVSAAVQLGADGDADGIADDRDACLYSPRGIVVGPSGCSTPGDEDEDQVADVVDACPQSPAGALVDAQGCALDDDLDGVADGIDRCAGSSAGSRVDARGCAPGQTAFAPPVRRARPPAPMMPAPPMAPVAAPAVPAPVAPQAAVPPPPARVIMPLVTSPATPPPAPTPAPAPSAAPQSVRLFGPATPPPAAPTAAEPERIFVFEAGESDLGWTTSRAIKQSARELLPDLEKNPSAGLVVSGHGDIKFDGMSVPRVASARAMAVRDALVANGVPAQRITVRVPGINEPRFYGGNQPRNCRVELRMTGRPPTPVAAAATVAAATPVAAPTIAVAPAAKPAAPVSPRQSVFPDPPARLLPVPPPRPTTPPPAPPAARPAAPAAATAGAATTVATTPRALAQATVRFDPFSAVLNDEAIQVLNGFAHTGTRVMLADTASLVQIVSGIGPGEAGATAQRLSESRAASVSAYLVSLGLPNSRMEVSSQTQTGERRADVRVVSR